MVYAVAAACSRTAILLITRAYLVGADARLTTWYSMLSSTAVFIAIAFTAQTWNMPHSVLNWIWLVTLSFATTAAILFIFLSTVRIGAFRTAVIMHLEPLSATVLSTVVLGEVVTAGSSDRGHHNAGCFDCIPGLEVAYRPRIRSRREHLNCSVELISPLTYSTNYRRLD